jgi:hypothetical protein
MGFAGVVINDSSVLNVGLFEFTMCRHVRQAEWNGNQFRDLEVDSRQPPA